MDSTGNDFEWTLRNFQGFPKYPQRIKQKQHIVNLLYIERERGAQLTSRLSFFFYLIYRIVTKLSTLTNIFNLKPQILNSY